MMTSRLGKLTRMLSQLIPVTPLRRFGRPTALFLYGVAPYTDDARAPSNHYEIGDFVRIVKTVKERFQVLP